jgi:hypothetical protein
MGIISYMNIHDIPERIKSHIGIIDKTSPNTPEEFDYDQSGEVERHMFLNKLFLSLIIILVASLSFGLGRLSVVGNRIPMKIEFDPSLVESGTKGLSGSVNTASVVQSVPDTETKSGEVVASSKGTKYHYSYCPGAKQISEKNKITFQSASQAESAGYSLASNCKPR